MKVKNRNFIWANNAIISFLIAGIYFILLIMLAINPLNYFSSGKILDYSLVIHLNLILVSLSSIVCYVWNISEVKTGLENLLAYCGFLGIILISISPLYPEYLVGINHYIPIMENIIFIIGFGLFYTVMLILAIYSVFTSLIEKTQNYSHRIIKIVKISSSLMFILVWICCYLSLQNLNHLSEIVAFESDFYYKMLFCSGTHLLQFIYIQIFMIILLSLVEIIHGKKLVYNNIYEMLFILNFILSFMIFIGHYKYEIENESFKLFCALYMTYISKIVPMIFVFILILEFVQKYKNILYYSLLTLCIVSIILFMFGTYAEKIIVIYDINVVIPIYYHYNILGVGLIFMAFCYILRNPKISKNIIYLECITHYLIRNN